MIDENARRDAAATAKLRELDLDRALFKRPYEFGGPRTGFAAFAYLAWPHVMPVAREWNWHHDLMCEELELWIRGVNPDVAMAIPPGHTKSTLVHVLLPAWAWPNVDMKIKWGFFSYSERFLHRDSKRLVELLKSPWYRSLYGDLIDTRGSIAMSDFSIKGGGGHFYSTPGGQGTGGHFNAVVVDDSVKAGEANGYDSAGIAAVAEWWESTMPTRMEKPETHRQLVIQQRLCFGDLIEIFVKQGARYVCLPMRAIKDEYTHPKDTRKPGEQLWPGRISPEKEAKLRRMLREHAPWQLDQRPGIKGTTALSPKAFIQMPVKWWPTHTDPNITLYSTWDFSFLDAEEAKSKSAGFVAGRYNRPGEEPLWYIYNGFVDFAGFLEQVALIDRFNRQYPTITQHLVEKKANGPAVLNTLKKRIPKVIGIEPHGSKPARMHSVSWIYDEGRVIFPPDDHAPWVVEAKKQILGFPRAQHNDAVDAMSQLLDHGSETSYDDAIRAILRRDGPSKR